MTKPRTHPIIALFCLLLSVSALYSQTRTSAKPTLDFLNGTLNVKFTSDSTIYDVLIIITSSKGETVFMDHRNRFEGVYKQTIDLSAVGKDEYLLRITLDDFTQTKRLVLE